MSRAPRRTSERFHALDLLRGFFIVVIIWDHLSRWPSFFAAISGKALLWVTAAEGFVIISGLLVGYIRGYKSKELPFKKVAFTLWRRALTLYIWAVLASIIYTAVMWHVSLVGGAPGMPIDKDNWGELIIESITLNYTFLWVYFLKLYALFLAAAPLAVWLLRKGHAWVVALVSFALLCLGWLLHDEVLQWQFLFFIPAVVGYFIPAIRSWWKARTRRVRQNSTALLINITILTIIISYIGVYHPAASSTINWITTALFAKDSISLFRAAVAFVWFTTYLLVFIRLEKYIQRWFGWLLMPIGTHSLTAYILHGAAIIGISYLFATSENIFVNTLLGILALLTVWIMLKIPGINRVIPR